MALLAAEVPVAVRQQKLNALLQHLSTRAPRGAAAPVAARPRPVAVVPPPVIAAPVAVAPPPQRPVVAAVAQAQVAAAVVPVVAAVLTPSTPLSGDRKSRLEQLLGQVIAFRRHHKR